jgi:hypothetical protein
MRNWDDPEYQLGVKGVNDKVEVANEQELYKKLKEKVRAWLLCQFAWSGADRVSGARTNPRDVLCLCTSLEHRFPRSSNQ